MTTNPTDPDWKQDKQETSPLQPMHMHSGPIQAELFDGTLNGYQAAAQNTAIYPGRKTIVGLVYVSLKGAGEAGEFAEHVGKALRDDHLILSSGVTLAHDGQGYHDTFTFGKLSDKRRDLLIKEVGDGLWYLAAKCTELGITLEEAARINIDKLLDRQKRGTLSGSGDNR